MKPIDEKKEGHGAGICSIMSQLVDRWIEQHLSLFGNLYRPNMASCAVESKSSRSVLANSLATDRLMKNWELSFRKDRLDVNGHAKFITGTRNASTHF